MGQLPCSICCQPSRGTQQSGDIPPFDFFSFWSQPPLKYLGLEPIIPSETPQEKDVDYSRKGRREKWAVNGHTLKIEAKGNVKLRALDDDDWTDSETEAGHVSNGDARQINLHPWLADSVTSKHSSRSTVLEDDVHSRLVGEKEPYQASPRTPLPTSLEGSDLADYSDHEADITSDFKSARHSPGWTPRFLQNQVRLPAPHTKDSSTTPPLDEIVSGTGQRTPSQNPRDSSKRHESPRWQTFWRDVNERIQHQDIS